MAKKNNILDIKEEFKNRDYELLSTEYVNQRKKLLFICNKHKEKGIQEVSYDKFKYRNNGCHYCALEKQLSDQRLSYDDAKHITEEKGFDFVDIKYGKELGKSSSLIYYYCKKHRHVGVQHKIIRDMKNSDGECPYCKMILDTYTLKEKMSNIIPHIEILGEYKGQKEKVLCKCNIHDELFYGKPYKLSQGIYGCKQCRRNKIQKNNLLTTDEFKKRLNEVKPELVVIGEYIDSTTPLELYCTIHDTYFYEAPNTYLYKKRMSCCPEMNVQAKTDEDFKKELYDKFNGDIISLEPYKTYFEDILFKCIKHDYEWMAKPVNVLKGKGCPKCTGSINEIKVSNFLENNNHNYISQKRFDDCRDMKPLPFDFYLPDYNLCIEYDGEGHYLESFYACRSDDPKKLLEYTQYHDQIKTQYCKDNNINLLRIPYWEKDNIEQILINKIKNIQKLAC